MIALKEWAAICEAVHAGAQKILLRKGGIAEPSGAFRVEHSSFLLYPTYLHEERPDALQERARPWIDLANLTRPAPGLVRLRTFATVQSVRWLATLDEAMAMQSQHFWSARTIEERYRYREPGLFCITLATESRPAVLHRETPEQAGCKSWVHLEMTA